MDSYVQLTYGQVALAASLILINGMVSLLLGLRLERALLLASLRTVVQLLLVGLVLEWVFRLDHWFGVLAIGLTMTLLAGVTAVGRTARRYPGIWYNTILAVWASAWLVTGFALLAVIDGGPPWYRPQYAIPLLGMVLGNTLNGISVGLSSFTDSVVGRRFEIETSLALGASRWEAARPIVQHAVRTGMIPILNSMAAVGIVSLPGMMTGQLLSGTPPIEAVKYQIVIMFLIASATSLGTVGAVLLGYLRLFTPDHRFAYQRVTTARTNRTP